MHVDSAATPMYHYAYDGAGNRVAWTTPGGACSTDCTEYDAQDRLIRYGAVGSEVTFTYQPGGALASRTEGANTTTYTYGTLPNGTETLWRVDLPGGTNVSYQVDAFGRRTARLVNGAVTHRWVFGPPGEGVTSLRPLAQLSAAGAIEQVYLYGTSPLTPDVILSDLTESGGTWTGNAYRVIADQVGSVRRIVNAETGVTVFAADYSPFGVVISETGAFDQPFGFAGGMRDELTGLTRFGARDYDPQVGRWTSKDPIRFDGGLNLYEYAAGAPQMYVDPTGLWVYAQFNRSTGSLFVFDVDSGLFTIIGANSGGRPRGAPIPRGGYDILERAGNPDFYRLDAVDSRRLNDVHEPTGRSRFRLHRPGMTEGCIAANSSGPWRTVKQLLNNTSTTTVTDEATFMPATDLQERLGTRLFPSTPRNPIRRLGHLEVI